MYLEYFWPNVIKKVMPVVDNVWILFHITSLDDSHFDKIALFQKLLGLGVLPQLKPDPLIIEQ